VTVEIPIMPGTDQHTKIGWADLNSVMQFAKVTLPVGHDGHAGARQTPCVGAAVFSLRRHALKIDDQLRKF